MTVTAVLGECFDSEEDSPTLLADDSVVRGGQTAAHTTQGHDGQRDRLIELDSVPPEWCNGIQNGVL